MNPQIASVAACVFLPFAMVVCAIAGHRFGRLHVTSDPDVEPVATGTIDAAILSLLGLLTAFTFSTAYSRYESRRQLIVDEVNAIGTAYLRIDLLPSSRQDNMREMFRQYAVSRYELWEQLTDRSAAEVKFAENTRRQNEIWDFAVEATKGEVQGDARKLLLPALNEMIDITTTRYVAMQAHPPLLIFISLGVLAITAAGMSGFGMAKSRRPSLLHLIGFALASALALYVILDIEYPRYGFVTLDTAHELLRDLQGQMK